jgi:hypothetical protein
MVIAVATGFLNNPESLVVTEANHRFLIDKVFGSPA